MNQQVVLAIETSCDETSVAIVAGGSRVLANVVSSQVDLHARFGGVVPEVASRAHLELLEVVLQEALDEAEMTAVDMAAFRDASKGLVDEFRRDPRIDQLYRMIRAGAQS